jgi:hypothetical protein
MFFLSVPTFCYTCMYKTSNVSSIMAAGTKNASLGLWLNKTKVYLSLLLLPNITWLQDKLCFIYWFLNLNVLVCYLCGESGHSGNICSNTICYNCNKYGIWLYWSNLCHSEDFQDCILGTMVGFLIWSVIDHGFDSRLDKKHYKLVFSPSWHRAKTGWSGVMKMCPVVLA